MFVNAEVCEIVLITGGILTMSSPQLLLLSFKVLM